MSDIRATPYNRASEEALRIYSDVLAGVRADKLMADSVRRVGSILEIQDKRLDLSSFRHVYVCGAGKASFAMAKILADILGPLVSGGLVVTKHGHGGEIPGIRVLESSHPIPDESSLEAGRQMLAFAAQKGPDDLVLFCLSGGASALMESLKDGVSLADLQDLNRKMLAEGDSIYKINVARSKLSRIKAGGLGEAFLPSQIGVLVISDVIDGTPETIGSGPFWNGASDEEIPFIFEPSEDGGQRAVRSQRQMGFYVSFQMVSRERETLGEEPFEPQGLAELAGPPLSDRVFHRFIGNSNTARQTAWRSGGKLQFRTPERSLIPMRRDARYEAQRVAKAALGLNPGEYVVFAGEPTVTIRGNGKGGRCQELACAAAPLIAGHADLAILAGSTDGTDGPTDVGAALVDGESVARAAAKGVTAEAALSTSDSFRFLEACNGLIYTGPTQSNVNDIVIAIRL